ncbi:MAG TPA: AarF/UbiB family protein, partial [Gemmatimonadales bacterium]
MPRHTAVSAPRARAAKAATPAAPVSPRAPPAAVETPRPGLLRRAMSANRHLIGLLCGALVARVEDRRQNGTAKGLGYQLERALATLVRPLLRRDLADQPFPVQLRRRLELLGPTYIKLGQVLSLREDLLPKSVTDELKNLLGQLPAVPFARVVELVEQDLGRPQERLFAWIDPEPLGSASIAQIHRATTREGDPVVLKVVKPGIRETLKRDATLLGMLGS